MIGETLTYHAQVVLFLGIDLRVNFSRGPPCTDNLLDLSRPAGRAGRVEQGSNPHPLFRFDLIFLMLDPQDENFDKRLATHLVSLYYRDITRTQQRNESIVSNPRIVSTK